MNLLKRLKDDVWEISDGREPKKINFYKEVMTILLYRGKMFNMQWYASICKKLEAEYEEILAAIKEMLCFVDMINVCKEVSKLYDSKIKPVVRKINAGS